MRPTRNRGQPPTVYAAMVRARRFLAMSIGALLPLALSAEANALTCIHHEDVRAAAREAVAGDHPLWADSYLIGRVDRVERDGQASVILTVTPTHVFGSEHGPVLRLGARGDGPPDPREWRAGATWFIALLEDEEIDGTDAVVSPCAPNFELRDADDVRDLVTAASTVDVRDPTAGGLPAGDDRGPLVFAGLAVVIGVASLLAFRRGRGERASS